MTLEYQTDMPVQNTAEDLKQLLASLPPDGYWRPTEPLPETQVEQLLMQVPASRRNLPSDLRALFRMTAYAYIGPNIYLMPLDAILDQSEANYGEFLDEDMPSLFLFAVDNGSNAYFCDTDGSLQHGVGAVYRSRLDVLLPEDCIWCAPSVTEFLRVTTAGKIPWDDWPRLKDMEAGNTLRS